MYAPRQHRQEKKKPYSNFLALENPEHEGPIMAPPVYSATGMNAESEEKEEQKDDKKNAAPAVKEATEQTAVQNNKQKQESEGGESESESASETQSVKKKPLGRSENPPQFKLKAGEPFQFKFASAPVQMKSGGSGGSSSASSGGSNSALPEHVKSQMEGSFGTSFDDVKVTANSNAAKDAGALAFAQGNNIHFAPGQYNPESKGGQELLGHELAHVVQQRQGRVQANTEISGMAVNNDHSLEAEADSMGAKAAQFKAESSAPVQNVSSAGSDGAVQMKIDPNAKPKEEVKTEDKEAE